MSGEKTEKPTPKRRRKAKEDGKTAKSADLTSAVVTIAVAGSLVFAGPPAVQHIVSLFRVTLTQAASAPVDEQLPEFLLVGLQVAALSAVPILTVAFMASAFTTYVQVGAVFTTKPATPDTNRLNPSEGFKRLFSKDRAVDLLKNSLRLTIIGAIAYLLFLDVLPTIISMTGRSLGASVRALVELAWHMSSFLLGTLLFFGVVDMVWQRHSFEKSILMSKQEVKDEYKESEGDPAVKAARKRLQRQMAREAEIRAVRDADAVVINPTHIAVALRYDAASRGAPHVLARGRGELAQRLRDEAKTWNIPIIRDVKLARSLVDLEIEQEVPEALYVAVAEVLKYVYSLRENNDG